ncbi:uncharacterized protein LOC126683489 [Mercurialis annua]|uniref:uncharacterized protein LOC126683489 n=1 Tax=Mercurialis annua TaxID=3986 RepID=UPI0024AD1A7A|nr:uncharacterized protein LOC126683489 [Mercurialis annua]
MGKGKGKVDPSGRRSTTEWPDNFRVFYVELKQLDFRVSYFDFRVLILGVFDFGFRVSDFDFRVSNLTGFCKIVVLGFHVKCTIWGFMVYFSALVNYCLGLFISINMNFFEIVAYLTQLLNLPPCQVWVDVEMSGTRYLTVTGGKTLKEYWYQDENLTMSDIAQRVNEMGYPEISRIGYYKPSGDWNKVTLVKDDNSLRNMFSEGYNFGYVQMFIEFKKAIAEFENYDRGESVLDAIRSYEAEKEADVGIGNAAIEKEGPVATENEAVDNTAIEMGNDNAHDESDSTYVCGSKEDSDDVSVSEGGSDFDDEYTSAREQKKNLRTKEVDGINGLGLDAMLKAPGGVASVNRKYWEGGAVGNLDAHAGVEESDAGSAYADSEDEMLTPSSSDGDNLEIKKRKRRTKWAICHGHDIRWKRSERYKVEARCIAGCSWRLYASRRKSCTSFRITGLHNEHTCQRASKNRQATSEWVAIEFIKKFRRQPSYKPCYMQGDLKDKYSGLAVPLSCCYRAKTIGMIIIRGSLETHYTKFRAYDAKLRRVDPEGLFRFHFINDPSTGDPVFQRYYVGFSGLRKGFTRGCRPVLCVDGCFLKTLVVGVLLSVVWRDANNQMYPVAWAIAEAENEETWTWFMELLISDLGFGEGLYLTLISDQQKGLKNAIRKVVSYAEHRNCARHIYANWKKKHKDPELKRLFWKAVNCTNLAEFESVLDMIKAEKTSAYDDFMKQLENIFCKAFVRPHSKCDAITSNLVETFNGYISKSRQLQAINMLEDIQSSLMERMSLKSELMDNHFEAICPLVRQRIDKNQAMTRTCEAKLAKGAFQVSSGEDQYVVNLKNKTCT